MMTRAQGENSGEKVGFFELKKFYHIFVQTKVAESGYMYMYNRFTLLYT